MTKEIWVTVVLCALLLLADMSSVLAQESGVAAKGTPSPGEDQLLDRLETMQKRIDQLEAESAARKKLQISDEEKQQKEKEVLTAAGREYSLRNKGTLSLEYSMSYQYNSTDVIQQALTVERVYDHTVSHTISGSYGVLDNVTVNTSIPFVYRFNRVGTEDEMQETDIGDISASVQWEPMKKKAGGYSVILNAGASLPTGRSPYEIDPNNELSTGSGTYAYTAGVNMSQPIDPLVVYGSLSFSRAKEVTGLSTSYSDSVLKSVSPGDTISVGMGFGYALSYIVSFSQQVSLSYIEGTRYSFQSETRRTATSCSAAYNIGAGWRLSTKTTLYTSLVLGLTSNQPDFSFSLRIPLDFVM